MNKTEITKPITILLVEDNPGDIRLVQEIFHEGMVPHHLEVVRDGEEAMRFLHRQKPFDNSLLPDLILLDLNLPKKSGDQVLAEIKSDGRLRKIPVIVLTASKAEEDINKAYNNHANCYLTKPIDLDQFIHVVQAIKLFWLSIVQFPEE
jgi:CheY-like chemotaxis protein